ncbi:DUF2062 domain-containing protein [Hydrogenophaga sp.]|uniref:DUF2062 domain-containing protein n=1 Tax=Hydrogenophaga sp. TaxID=1904254 RepID=UPI003F729B6B
MREKFRKWLPTPEALRNNRWLRWMGPVLLHPALWHFSRKGIALGVALGIFFGLLIPVAQIPASAAGAILLRANLPMAVASTLVSNPVTFGPVYYGAYRLGKVVLGERAITEIEAQQRLEGAHDEPPELQRKGFRERTAHWLERVRTVGKPLAVGLSIIATASGLTVYFLISGIWVLNTRRARRNRLREREKEKGRQA